MHGFRKSVGAVGDEERAGHTGEGFAFGVDGGAALIADDVVFALGGNGVLLLTPVADLLQRFNGDAVGGREDEEGVVAEALAVDGIGVDEVEVVTGRENGGDEFFGD